MKKLILVCIVICLVFCFVGLVFAAGGEVKKIKVAVVYNSNLEEPFINVIHKAFLKGEEELDIEYSFAEDVAPPDFERVMREYASRGYDLILAPTYGTEDAARRVAKDYKDIYFCFGSNLGPEEPNVAVFDQHNVGGSYLCGMIAGMLTKNQKFHPSINEQSVLGVVDALPIPVVNARINAYIMGAKEVNPEVVVKVSFIGSFFDPPKAKEATIAQIEAGADIIFAARYGVIDACETKGALAFGAVNDQYSLGPNVVITSSVWNFYPTIEKLITDIRGGAFEPIDLGYLSFLRYGGNYLAPYREFEDRIPDDVNEMVTKRIEEIKSGEFIELRDNSDPTKK